MKHVRFGVVGVGGMGGGHCRNIVKSRARQCRLAAVADIVPQIAQRVGNELNVPHFTSAEAMYASGLCDAVIVATPHYWHPVLGIQAARAGLHVLCEKPLAVAVGPARAMIRECKKRKVALGAMLQQRTRGIMVKMKHMVQSGRLGRIFRVQMICSDWYRTQAYYDSGAWRGTWDGEGGGILLNQAPHSLDLFQWIGGMPDRIVATVGTRDHKIEVENTANAICRYPGGGTGYIYATTAEQPGMEQLLVAGEKGTLIAEKGKLLFGRLKSPLREHMFSCPHGFATVPCDWQEVKAPQHGGGHMAVIRAFAKHVLSGTPMVATGEEAVNELEISNAIYISGYKLKAVGIPVDPAEIDRLIGRLQKERSTGRGGGLRAKAAREMRKLLA